MRRKIARAPGAVERALADFPPRRRGEAPDRAGDRRFVETGGCALFIIVVLAGRLPLRAPAPPDIRRTSVTKLANNRLLWGLLSLLPLTSILVSPLPTTAGEPPATVPSPAVVPALIPAPSPAGGGMIVARDPETGALTLPTPEQRRELLPEEFGAALRSDQPLFEEAVPGGGTMIRLDGRLMDYVLATRDANGKLSITCVHEADAANRLVADGAAAPAFSPEPEEE
jgi:hypothetical protein